MGITDCIRAQESLLAMWESPKGQTIMSRYCRATGDKFEISWGKLTDELRSAEPILVTPDICNFLEYAVNSWPDKFTLRREDIPLRQGFVMFEKHLWMPMQFLEERGEPDRADLAFLVWKMGIISDPSSPWYGRECLSYSFYDEEWESDKYYGGMFHSSGWILGENEDWAHNVFRKFPPTEWSLARMKLSVKYLMCFLRFISQKILIESLESVKNKGVRRSLERGSLRRVPDVHVVKLRRREYKKAQEEANPSGRKLDNHRWPVAGHFHNYHFSRTGEYRPLWIDAYEKGPENKPLIVRKKRAYKVER